MRVAEDRKNWLGLDAAALPFVVAFAVFVFLADWGGIELTSLTGRIAAIWISNAVVIAVALKVKRKEVALFLLAGFAANFLADLLTGDTVTEALALSACNMVEILIVVVALRRLVHDSDFGRPKTLLVFYGFALGPGPIASALFAGAYLHYTYGNSWSDIVPSWYFGDALGLVIMVPPLVTVRLHEFVRMFGKDERATTFLLLGVIGAVMAANLISGYPLAFMFFPAVLLMTFVRGFAGGTIGLLLAGGYLLSEVFVGGLGGAIAGHSLREQIIIVQTFGAVISFTVVLTGAALEERRRLERHMAVAVERARESREEALVAKDAAETANRTKSMFLANMSHELRTPLNAVIGFSEIMTGEMFGPLGNTKYRDYARMIRDAGDHLLELIDDVLDMSKIEAGKYEIVRSELDLHEIVDDCVALMNDRASEAGLTLVTEMPLPACRVNADGRALKQILLNLLSNAVKFTPSGGVVTVRVEGHAAGEVGPFCVLSVRDSGIGIPTDAVQQLGNPFVQLRDGATHTHKGTGLGLALVRALTEMHDGTMRIESRLGAGTCVFIELPLMQSTARPAQASLELPRVVAERGGRFSDSPVFS